MAPAYVDVCVVWCCGEVTPYPLTERCPLARQLDWHGATSTHSPLKSWPTTVQAKCVRGCVRVWKHHWYNTFKAGVVVACTCSSSTVQAHSPLHSDPSPLRRRGWVGPVMGGTKQYYPLGVQAKMPTYSSSSKSVAQFKPPTLAQHGKLAHQTPHQTPHQYLFIYILLVVCFHPSQMMM